MHKSCSSNRPPSFETLELISSDKSTEVLTARSFAWHSIVRRISCGTQLGLMFGGVRASEFKRGVYPLFFRTKVHFIFVRMLQICMIQELDNCLLFVHCQEQVLKGIVKKSEYDEAEDDHATAFALPLARINSRRTEHN